jgi:hypothetical protein
MHRSLFSLPEDTRALNREGFVSFLKPGRIRDMKKIFRTPRLQHRFSLKCYGIVAIRGDSDGSRGASLGFWEKDYFHYF